MKFTYSFFENINTVKFADILESMGIKILATPMIGVHTFMFITDSGTPEQIELAKQQAHW